MTVVPGDWSATFFNITDCNIGGAMARINIEECWWSDPRRTKLLLKIGFAADSAAVNMWRTAQEFWGRSRGLIPKHIFDKLEYASELIECGLADVRDRSVYVRGSSEYLDWHAEKREQAREAGKKSAESRRKKSGSAQPKGGKGHKKSEREPNDIRTQVNGTEPSGSLSLSGSNSDFGNENPPDSKPQAFLAGYCRRFKLKYGDNPEILGKDAGIATRVTKAWGKDKIELYLDAFFAMPDAWLVKTKHPIAAFETKINEIVVFAKSGEFTTIRQAQQADTAVAVSSQIQRIREGKL